MILQPGSDLPALITNDSTHTGEMVGFQQIWSIRLERRAEEEMRAGEKRGEEMRGKERNGEVRKRRDGKRGKVRRRCEERKGEK